MSVQSIISIIGIALGIVGTILGIRSERRAAQIQKQDFRKNKGEAYYGIRRLLTLSTGLPCTPEDLLKASLDEVRDLFLRVASHAVEISETCAAVAPELLSSLLDVELTAKQLSQLNEIEEFEIGKQNRVMQQFALLYRHLSTLEFAAISFGDLPSHELRDYSKTRVEPKDHEFYRRNAIFDCNAKGIPWQPVIIATSRANTTLNSEINED